ncbi:hypothetical protein MIR68_001630 [Amoeboaphelidium protococcarum]|nr:hypothetical protein MIR68_001630 [Amoeboaphelidium protococcarum]
MVEELQQIEDLHLDPHLKAKIGLNQSDDSQTGSKQLKCVKCKTADGIHKVKHDFWCQDCVISNARIKYKSNMQLFRGIDRLISIAVVFYGDLQSSLLVHLLCEHFSRLHSQSQKRFIEKMLLMYVYNGYRDSSAIDASTVQEYFKSIQLKYSNINIESRVIQMESQLMHHGNLSTDIFDLASSPTGTQDLEDNLKYRIHLRECSVNDIQFLCYPDTADILAQKVISLVAKGCADQIPFKTRHNITVPLYKDNDKYDAKDTNAESKQLCILRPICDMVQNEVEICCRVQNLPAIVKLSPIPQSFELMSIDQLVDQFISGLNSEFVSTVPTIIRTSKKLHSKGDGRICDFCSLPVVYIVEDQSSSDQVCDGCRVALKDCHIDMSIFDKFT